VARTPRKRFRLVQHASAGERRAEAKTSAVDGDGTTAVEGEHSLVLGFTGTGVAPRPSARSEAVGVRAIAGLLCCLHVTGCRAISSQISKTCSERGTPMTMTTDVTASQGPGPRP
jgi:hypothetical protein